MNSVTSVTCEIRLHLLVSEDDAWAVPTTLSYRPADPYAVHATMNTASESIDWVFSRELLHDGLRHPCGVGDLHVEPGTDDRGRTFVSIDLSAPDGHAVLRADATDLAAFLADTFLAVPLGEESAHLDLEAVLLLLLTES